MFFLLFLIENIQSSESKNQRYFSQIHSFLKVRARSQISVVMLVIEVKQTQ